LEQYYTISSDPRRLDGADNYGNVTDSLFFEGETENVLYKHAPTTVVQKGTTLYGEITNETSAAGKPWRKFSKRQVPEDTTTVDTSTSSPNAPQARSNSGDGMRQGMSINNAAKYIIETAVRDGVDYTPTELALQIEKYAFEIFKIDLTVTANESDQPE
jgi:hypothetical protein